MRNLVVAENKSQETGDLENCIFDDGSIWDILFKWVQIHSACLAATFQFNHMGGFHLRHWIDATTCCSREI